ncbi:MAG: DUF1573 domain-containing protein [Planctomycetales bacterium]
MRFRVLLVGIVATIASLAVVVLIARPPESSTGNTGTQVEEGLLEPSPTPPWPKAVVDKTEFHFGRMEVGDKGTHDFTIRNEGEAPLKLQKGPTTCQCTISEVPNNQVAPGETVNVTLTWEPFSQAEAFEKGAEIYTNDPQLKSIRLSIVGMVSPMAVIMPERDWHINDFHEVGITEFKGIVVSPLVEKFSITGLECDSAAVSFETSPVEPENLESMHGLSGYHIHVRVKPEMPIGRFIIPIRIKTDLRIKKTGEPVETTVMLTGQRRGPIRLIGNQWFEEKGGIVLGSFNAIEGKKIELLLTSKDEPEEGLKLLGSESDPEQLRVSLEPAGGSGKIRRYTLSVEYPPESPRVIRREEDPAKIRIKTNHPGAPEIEFGVYFSAF